MAIYTSNTSGLQYMLLIFNWKDGWKCQTRKKTRKERIYTKRDKLAFRWMRAFEGDSLAGKICLCEDLYLEKRISAPFKNQSIRRL